MLLFNRPFKLIIVILWLVASIWTRSTVAHAVRLDLAAVAAKDPAHVMDGYKIGKMGFNGTVEGHEIRFQGSIQEIIEYTDKMYPGVKAAFESEVAKMARDEDSISSLNSREMKNYYCWPVPSQGWEYSNPDTIQSGIRYLRRIGNPRGTAVCNVGERSCVRVSCSYNDAIYVCNDNPWTIYPPCTQIADYAEFSITHCTFIVDDGRHRFAKTGGQFFDKAGFNTIVRHDSC